MARFALVFAAHLAILGLSPSAFAQSNQALAETLFQDGRRLMTAGNYAEACPKLEESQRLDPGTGTLLNWGLCLKEAGKPASAWVVFNQAAASARTENRADRVALADAEIKKLETAMPRLSVVVPPEADLPGLTVSVDSATLAPAARGVASPVDPGKHVVTVSATGRKTWTNNLDVQPGAQTHTVVVPVLEPLSAAQPVAGSLVGVTGGGAGAVSPAQEPPKREKRWLFGARLDVAFPVGKADSVYKLSDYTTTQGGFWFEGGYKLSPSLMLGAFIAFGFGGPSAGLTEGTDWVCGEDGVSCSIFDMRLGLQGTYTFNAANTEARTRPWIGLGIGYEVLQASLDHLDTSLSTAASGAEWLMLQGGVDFDMNAFAIGPFLATSLARYTSATAECYGPGCVAEGKFSGDIPDPTFHGWIQLGVRGTFGF